MIFTAGTGDEVSIYPERREADEYASGDDDWW
jgi:hypothetical protein